MYWCGWCLAAGAIRRLSPIIWKWVSCFWLPFQLWCVSKMMLYTYVHSGLHMATSIKIHPHPMDFWVCSAGAGFVRGCQFLFWRLRFVLIFCCLLGRGELQQRRLCQSQHAPCVSWALGARPACYDLPAGSGWCHSSHRPPWLKPKLSWMCWKSFGGFHSCDIPQWMVYKGKCN